MQIRLEEGPQRNYKNYENYENHKILQAPLRKLRKSQNFASPSTKIGEEMQIRVEEGPQQTYENYENFESWTYLQIIQVAVHPSNVTAQRFWRKKEGLLIVQPKTKCRFTPQGVLQGIPQGIPQGFFVPFSPGSL